MATRIGVLRAGEADAWRMAAYSRYAIERGADAAVVHDAELWVAVARDAAVVAGAFQRGTGDAQWRRGSGGPAVALGAGTVHVVFSPASPRSLGPSGEFDETKIVNRLVRPLLRGLTKAGFLAHFFGRDWIAVAHAPVGWVGFAHDATSRRAVFEAFVGVTTPFASPGRSSLLGKTPIALDAIGPVDGDRLVSAIIDAYAGAYEADLVPISPDEPFLEASAPGAPTRPNRDRCHGNDPPNVPKGPAGPPDGPPEPPWAATADEAIGLIGAGPDATGVFRVGGDLLVSRDALARLEERAAAAPLEALGRVVDETLGAPGVALDGVRSLESVRDVIARARASHD
jgi:hypothetical protein